MKILFVTPYVPSPIRVRPYHLLRELTRHHEVTLLSTDAPRMFGEADVWRRTCQRVELVPLRTTTMIRGCVAGALRGAPLQAAVCHSKRLDARLTRLLREERFDVVHVEHLRAAALHERLPPHLPAVYDAVDCISLLLERTLRSSHSMRQRLQSLVELGRTRRYEGKLLARYDGVTVTAPEDAAALGALPGAGGRRPIVIPNGVDFTTFHPRPDLTPEGATLILSGKMSYHANVTAALHFVRDILPRIRARYPEVRLTIAGSSPPEELRRIAAASGGSIHVTGYLPDLTSVLGRATVSVCPVVVKVGIQNKVLEAMAMGVPVVASRAGAEGLGATPGRDLLVAESDEQFANQVVHLLSSQSVARTIGAAGHEYVASHHQWSAAAGQFVMLYEEVVRRRIAYGSTVS